MDSTPFHSNLFYEIVTTEVRVHAMVSLLNGYLFVQVTFISHSILSFCIAHNVLPTFLVT